MSPSKRALLIASPFGGLRGPLNDAIRIKDYLEQLGFDVVECNGDDATRDGIRTAWLNLIKQASDGDTIVIYYSGHGGLVESKRKSSGKDEKSWPTPKPYQFIVPIDFDKTTTEDFRGILDIEIAKMLRDTTEKTTNVTVILDCCHSGRLARHLMHENDAIPKQLFDIQFHDLTKWIEVLRFRGQLIGDTFIQGNPHAVRIAASGTGEIAWEYHKDNKWCGILTESLIRALEELKHESISWRTLLLRVRELVQTEFPQQHPRVEGPDTRVCFSLEKESSKAFVVTKEGQDLILHGGRVVGVHEGNEYVIMPFESTQINEQNQIGKATVTNVSGFSAKLKLKPSSAAHNSLQERALAFLCQESLYQWPVILPDDPDLREAIEKSKFLRPYQKFEDTSTLAKFEKESGKVILRTENGIEIASCQVNDQSTSPTNYGRIVSSAENLATAQHIRSLKPVVQRDILDHELKVEFGTVHPENITRPIEDDGSGVITVGDYVYISLYNMGKRTIYVSVFSVNVNGAVSLVTTLDPEGIELEACASYIVGMNMNSSKKSLEGIPAWWPKDVPKGGRVPESLILVLSSASVDLRHLESSHEKPSAYDIARKSGDSISSLEKVTFHIVLGTRGLGSQGTMKRMPYDVIEIPFSMEFADGQKSEQRPVPPTQIPEPENTPEWNIVSDFSPHTARKGSLSRALRALRGIPPSATVENHHTEAITVVVSKYRPYRPLSGLRMTGSATGGGVNYNTTTFFSPATTKVLAPRSSDGAKSRAVFPLWTRDNGFGVVSVFVGEEKKFFIENHRIPIGATVYFKNRPDLAIVSYQEKHAKTILHEPGPSQGVSAEIDTAVCEGVIGNLPLLGQSLPGFLEYREKCEIILQTQLLQTQPENYCRSLLALGIITMLQGESGYASEIFNEVFKLAQTKFPKLYIQAIQYLIQCRHMQFQWSSASGSVSGAELSQAFDLQGETNRLELCLQKAHSQEYYSLRGLANVLLLQREYVLAYSISQTDAQMDASRLRAGRLAEAIKSCSVSGIKEATLAPYRMALANLFRRIGDEDRSRSEVDSIGPLNPSDLTLRAHHELVKGDVLATTFGVPETWNMLLQQGTTSNAEQQNNESLYFANPQPKKLQQAQIHYRASNQLYEVANYKQGLAAIQIRLGYLATLGYPELRSGSFDAYKIALSHVNLAKDLYGQAGDIAGVQLATAHSSLCRLGMSQPMKNSKDVEDIGRYGATNGSRSSAFGFGLLFAKYARRWLVFLGDYEKALAAHELAAALFRSLGMKLSWAYSVYDQISVYELLGDQSMIHITAEKALGICNEIEQETPRTSKIFQMAKFQEIHIWIRIFEHANRRADPNALENISSILRGLRDADMGMSIGDDKEETLTQGTSSGLDPAISKSQYYVLNEKILMADALIPLYRSREAVRAGDSQKTSQLLNEAESAITANPSSNSEIILVSISVDRGNFKAAAVHARRYQEQLSRNEIRVTTGMSQEEISALRRSEWEAKTSLLLLFTRVRLYKNARIIENELNQGWGPNWWGEYEYPIWHNLCTSAIVSGGLREYEKSYKLYKQAMDAFEKQRDTMSTDDLKMALAGDSIAQEVFFGAAVAAARWHLSESDITTNYLSIPIQGAFTAIERGKARSLLDLIEGAAPDYNTNKEVQSNWQQYKRQGTRLTTLRNLLYKSYNTQGPSDHTNYLKLEVERNETILRDLEATLSMEKRDPTTKIGTVLSLPSLCELLPPSTALLQYCYTKGTLVRWKITRSGVTEVFVSDVPDATLEAYILQFHKACERRSSKVQQYKPWLVDMLLPFRSLDESRLVIVPCRTLHQLPFHALDYHGEILMAHRKISYLPSASVLKFLQFESAPASDISILAIGNPSNMKHRNPLSLKELSLDKLPSSELEVKAIEKLIKGTKALTNTNATKAAVSKYLSSYRVLHFATHGSLSKHTPFLSAIHLAEGENITVEDFMWRPLKAELVVLSACETGRGVLTDGDDVVGFARALLASGVKNVVVSLWKVSDDVTAFFMIKFYEYLKRTWSPADALQAAQMATRNTTMCEAKNTLSRTIGTETWRIHTIPLDDYKHPYYWAPFVLIGSGADSSSPTEPSPRDT